MAESMTLYASPSGSDDNDGLASDRALQTLRGARDAVRRARSGSGGAGAGITVRFAAGEYPFSQTVDLGSEDSGTESAPVRYEGTGEVRFMGGRIVRETRGVSDQTVRSRLRGAAREHVVEVGLRELGIDDIGGFGSRGYTGTLQPSHPEPFVDHAYARISRYPRDGYLRVAGVPEEGLHDDEHGKVVGDANRGFVYDDERIESWAGYDDVWMHAYWCWDWANSYNQIDAVDPSRKRITMKPPHDRWGIRVGNRYQFLNVLEELSEPGDYCLDPGRGLLYIWLPEDHQELYVSLLGMPLVRLDGTSHLSFHGLIFEGTRSTCVEVRAGAGVAFSGCTVRHVGNHAVRIEGGTNHRVEGCEIYNTGDGGVWVDGGDRASLTPCNHSIVGNTFHHFTQWSRVYRPAVHCSGVGMRIAHNLMHDAPHSGIIYWGNEFLIEYNEIHHVTQETGDAGAIYTGRDFTARGNIVRYNYIHDMGGVGMGSMGIYWDDCVSGQTAYGNIIVRASRGVMMGGGRELVVKNNIFVDCRPALQIDGRGMSRSPVWVNMVYNTMKGRLKEVDYANPPYSERYPALLDLVPFFDTPDDSQPGVPPEHNTIACNICAGGVWADMGWHDVAEYLSWERNLIDSDPGFVDRDSGDYRLKDDSPAWALGFERIPVEKIGPGGWEADA